MPEYISLLVQLLKGVKSVKEKDYMVRRVHCGKRTKIYIPKIENPQILTYRRSETEMKTEQGSTVYNVIKDDVQKRR